jgi:hypothetical protein
VLARWREAERLDWAMTEEAVCLRAAGHPAGTAGHTITYLHLTRSLASKHHAGAGTSLAAPWAEVLTRSPQLPLLSSQARAPGCSGSPFPRVREGPSRFRAMLRARGNSSRHTRS